MKKILLITAIIATLFTNSVFAQTGQTEVTANIQASIINVDIPTVKISTNNDLYKRKSNWMDFNAGQLVDGISEEVVLKDLIELLVTIANGEYTKQELNDYREIAIFKSGVTL